MYNKYSRLTEIHRQHTITKTIGGQDALSISPFLVIDDNHNLFYKRCVYSPIESETPPKCVLGLLLRP
jgi:hypothetical protein